MCSEKISIGKLNLKGIFNKISKDCFPDVNALEWKLLKILGAFHQGPECQWQLRKEEKKSVRGNGLTTRGDRNLETYQGSVNEIVFISLSHSQKKKGRKEEPRQ